MMTERRDRSELERRAADRRRLKQTARLLERARPEPSRDFRATLAQRLLVEPLERRRLLRTARLLEGARPQPRPSFRSRLGSELGERGIAQEPRRLIAAYAASGVLLLLVAAAGVIGLGPLAAG
jgi:hypothetical protein